MQRPSYREHPHRELLLRELHARPSEPLQAPLRLSQMAVLSGEKPEHVDGDREHLARLCARKGGSAPAEDAKHHVTSFGGLFLKWERHTEFCSYTFYRRAHFNAPFADPVIEEVPQDWLADLPGLVLSALHIAILPRDLEMPDVEDISLRHFEGNPVVGNLVAGGKARVWADFRMHTDHFTRFLVQDNGLDRRHAGRTVQRLIEMNTYRALALMALPIAQEISPRLRTIDEGLADISARMADTDDQTSDADLLGRLSQLSADIESLAARTSYRFAATRAYYGLVQQRLQDLRMSRMDGLLTLDGFLARRLGPAMATCESAAERQEALAQRATRVGSLLRARVEVGLEHQNRDLLDSMNERAKVQLKLQETVEGLSVVAISYYAIGLAGYVFKAAEKSISLFDATVATGITAPLIVALVWYGLRRAKRAVVTRRS
ncbi:DUF3422 family protein [Roseospira visakhapatnamensis]|uniref:Putative membrane-anchored protein n=1 Tax=Roseospira visakhapatnamensis TaxID=390880 RepID=A0A7W6RE15_9PROT|nr:DUF3422 domain-containing protein [Roseospira visakhapatnamensis]MBB4266830.1 putative membrane-anchored protein [Roseospira visakhapatnamensis]